MWLLKLLSRAQTRTKTLHLICANIMHSLFCFFPNFDTYWKLLMIKIFTDITFGSFNRFCVSWKINPYSKLNLLFHYWWHSCFFCSTSSYFILTAPCFFPYSFCFPISLLCYGQLCHDEIFPLYLIILLFGTNYLTLPCRELVSFPPVVTVKAHSLKCP